MSPHAHRLTAAPLHHPIDHPVEVHHVFARRERDTIDLDAPLVDEPSNLALRLREPGGHKQTGDVDRFSGGHVDDRHVGGHLPALEQLVELLPGRSRPGRAVVERDDPLGKITFCLGGLGCHPGGERGHLGRGEVGAQRRVGGHRRIRNRHQLAELLRGGLPDADPVAQRLAHLLHAVRADQQRHGDDDLRREPRVPLERTADQVVVGLVGTTELDVGVDRDGVVPLQQRVEELHQADGPALPVPAGEVVTFEQLGNGKGGGGGQEVLQRQLLQPLRVAADLHPVRVEDAHHLVEVLVRVGDRLLGGQHLARGRFAGRVPHPAGEVPDDQDGGVPEILELAQFAEHDSMAEGQLRAGRVDPELHPQRPVLPGGLRQLGPQPVDRQDLRAADRQPCRLCIDVRTTICGTPTCWATTIRATGSEADTCLASHPTTSIRGPATFT